MENDNYNTDEFLTNFYKKLKCFSNIFYTSFIKNIKHTKKINNWNEGEIAGFIILNKIFFQHINSYFLLIENKLYVPGFNELRAVIELFRLLRIYIGDEEFRNDYILNDNLDFYHKYDKSFMQGEVNKKLDKIEFELRSKDKIPLSLFLQNHDFTKESNISQIHSELSKWSHALNKNLIFPMFISKNKINLDIYNEPNFYSYNYIRKYLEAIYIIMIEHYLLVNSFISLDINDDIDEMFEMYDLFINKYYK